MHFDWLPDNHRPFTVCRKVEKPRVFGQHHGKCVLNKRVFSMKILGIVKNDQLSSNLDLQLLCTIGNICIYNILKYYIFSSRNEQYHSLRQLVYRFEFWMFCFVSFLLSFLFLLAKKTCAFLRGRHGTQNGRPATGGLLESETS